MTPAQDIDHRFTSPIEKEGAFATFLTVPGSADVLGTRRAVKVAGTLDGHPFTATLMPSGEGPHWLPVKKARCAGVGRPRAGAAMAEPNIGVATCAAVPDLDEDGGLLLAALAAAGARARPVVWDDATV